jgi:predicted aconitase with swiveling domain
VTSGTRLLRGRPLVGGTAAGRALVLDEPLSFWGGVDPRTGLLTDPHHPQRGADLRGRALVMPSGRGSSSSSTILAEAVRLETSPAAVLMATMDPIVALGSIVAGELYGRALPVVVLDPTDYGSIGSGDLVQVETRNGVALVRVARAAQA